MNKYQRETDGKTCEVVGGAVSLGGSTKHYKHEYASEDNLGDESAPHFNALLQVVGSSAFNATAVGSEKEQDCRTNESADNLEYHVENTVFNADALSDHASESDGWVDVATANATDSVGHSHNGQTKSESSTHNSGDVVDWVTTKAYCYTAAHKHEHHSAHHFG